MSAIVLTGIGPVSAIGIGRAAWHQGVQNERSGIGPLTLFAADQPAGEVGGFDLDALLPSKKTYLDRASAFALAAGQLALTDAGLAPGALERWRAGVVLGSEFGCLATMQLYTGALQQKGARLANPLLFSHMYVNTPASLVAIEFGLGGHHGAFTGPEAGRQALESACEALRLDRADMILVIGVDVLNEPLFRAWQAEHADGADPLGEGACALVLERAAAATARGAVGFPFDDTGADFAPVRALLGRTFAAEPFFALARRMVLALSTLSGRPAPPAIDAGITA